MVSAKEHSLGILLFSFTDSSSWHLILRVGRRDDLGHLLHYVHTETHPLFHPSSLWPKGSERMGVRGPARKPRSHRVAGVLLSLRSVSSFVKEESGTINTYYRCTYRTQQRMPHNRENWLRICWYHHHHHHHLLRLHPSLQR